MKVKEHFAKMALDMIGEDKAFSILAHIGRRNKIPRNVIRGYFEELKNCKYVKVEEHEVIKVKQIPYE